MGHTAILIGATGLTGGFLLSELLDHKRYDRVITLSRKRIKKQHHKHENHVVDLFDPSSYCDFVKGDHLFICTGTTQAKTPDKKTYYAIEHDLPVAVARHALQNGCGIVVAISALGASPSSRFFYNRGKGEMERDIEALGYEQCYFVQPALIGGVRDEHRPFERFWKKAQAILDPLLVGRFKKYRTIHPIDIAQSMVYVALYKYTTTRIPSDELKRLAARYKDMK